MPQQELARRKALASNGLAEGDTDSRERVSGDSIRPSSVWFRYADADGIGLLVSVRGSSLVSTPDELWSSRRGVRCAEWCLGPTPRSAEVAPTGGT